MDLTKTMRVAKEHLQDAAKQISEKVKLITCFHDSWIYESTIFFPKSFFVLFFYKVKVFYWDHEYFCSWLPWNYGYQTRQQQFCCIFAATKDKFDYFLNKLFHSSTSHTYHHNSSLFLSRHKSFKRLKQALLFVKLFAHLLVSRSWSMSLKKYKRGVLKLNEKYFFFSFYGFTC